MAAAVLLVVGLAAAACSSGPAAETDATARSAAVSPTSVPTDVPTTATATSVPIPTAVPAPIVVAATAAERAEAASVSRAPLGSFVVARQPVSGKIAFFDEPFGEARALMTTDAQGVDRQVLLTDSRVRDAPVSLRVVAGGAGDEWLQVQAPLHDPTRTAWVNAVDFAYGFEPRRLEVDLAGSGELRLIEDGDIVMLVDLEMPSGAEIEPQVSHITVVSGSPTPTITLGSGVRLSASEAQLTPDIGVPAETLSTLGARVGPGTPVLVFDSSDPAADVTSVARRAMSPASTVSFDDESLASLFIAVSLDGPTLWTADCVSPTLTCLRTQTDAPERLPVLGGTFITATSDAGEVVPLELSTMGYGQQSSAWPKQWDARVVPVHVAPGEEQRTLIYSNEIDNIEAAMPLLNPTVFGQPLVLRVLQGAPGDQWVRVQAPVRPHGQSIWVRTDGFVFGSTTKHIEIDIAGEGELRLFDGDELLLTHAIVSGREHRPTTLHDTYIEQRIEGSTLSPAYGTWVLSLATFSNVLGTYGGGGMPGQSLHGTNQPELMGQKVSSGGIRVPNEVMDEIVAIDGIVGARVILFDSSTRGGSLSAVRWGSHTTAATTSFPETTLPIVAIPSYS